MGDQKVDNKQQDTSQERHLLDQSGFDNSRGAVSIPPPPFQLSANASLRGSAGDAPAPLQPKTRPGGLPGPLQAKMEESMGADFSEVNIHQNSHSATNMGALAYAQGNDLHFAPAQFQPDTQKGQELIGHELAHVVQQRQGRVKPTVQAKGLAINDDAGLEKEADMMGAKAARGKASQFKSSALGIRDSIRSSGIQAKRAPIQMKALKTQGGTWDVDKYDLRKDKDPHGTAYPSSAGVRGLDITLKFTPGDGTDAELIGLTQTAMGSQNGTLVSPDMTRAISKTDAIKTNGTDTDEGYAIDRITAKNNPIYGAADLGPGDGLDKTAADNNTTKDPTKVGLVTRGGDANATYQLGYHYKPDKDWLTKDAMLYDAPTLSRAAKNSKQIFETTALAIKGNQAGTYYGSVKWGWRTDGSGTDSGFTVEPFEVVSKGVPSSTFMKSAQNWNNSKTSTGGDTVDLPVIAVKLTTQDITAQMPADFIGPALTIPAGTRVQVLRAATPTANGRIKVAQGNHTGHEMEVRSADMATLVDERN